MGCAKVEEHVEESDEAFPGSDTPHAPASDTKAKRAGPKVAAVLPAGLILLGRGHGQVDDDAYDDGIGCIIATGSK